ncbi:MAG: filamentous hemagglutinin N-terminal domain-containing protein, partial [Burkholderiales bacterium]|nr:filamentous hemagglutinin N-terminal domain-containing protein [Burkholderiales bacterium]
MAAPETAKARGQGRRVARLGALALALAGAFGAQAAPPGATLPTGAQVIAGQAAVSTAGTTTTIQQASDRAILNWHSFSIGSGAAVNFVQPGAGAVALNRVVGNDPSEIHGRLTANGQVFLINPSGVLFGPGSRVDVGGLVASTMNIRNEDFLDGRYRFSRDGSTGAVVNRGEVQAKYAALLGPRVLNEGVISAPMGSIALAAGEAVTLGITGHSRLGVQVDRATIDTLVENRHLVKADGGTVLLSAQSAHALLGRVVNSGAVEANGISTEGGVVRLLASSSVQHSGVIRVDAGTHGKGGSAILLADLSNPASRTEVSGAISARGGAQSGDGGFIDTSAAKVQLAETLSVSTTAAQGRTGTWLIDPTDYVIAASGGDITGAALSAQLASSNITIQTPAGGSGNGDIFVNDAISWGANTTLTLSAHRDISLGADITKNAGAGDAGLVLRAGGSITNTGTRSIGATSGRLHVKLNSDADNSGGGAIALSNLSINTNGGNLSMGGGNLASQQAINPSYSQADHDDASVALLDTAKGMSGRVTGISLAGGTYDSGAGSLTLRGRGVNASSSTRGVSIAANTTVRSTSGSVTVVGIGGNGTSSNHGVRVDGANALITSANGTVTVNGTGGNSSGGFNYGVYLFNGGRITSTGNAPVVVTGTGGTGTGNNIGILANTAGSGISSVNGAVTVNGTAGNGTGSNNVGTYVTAGAAITGTGSAPLTITGRGGNGASGNYGVVVFGSTVASADGAVTVNGTGGSATGTSNAGVYLLSSGQISSTGNAPVTVTGTGGNGTSGNHGVLLETNSSISSGGGSVRLNGTRGAGTSFGLTTNGTNTLGQTGQSGNIALSTDSWGTAPTNIRTTGQVILAPLSTTATVGLNGGAGSVAIPNSWIAAINGSTPSRLVLGNPAGSATGMVSIGGGWNLTSAAAVGALVAGSAVPLEVHGGSITVGGITAGSKPLLLRANTGNLTLDSGTILSSDASGDAITLAAAGNFINNAGSTALSTPNGRWLVYSSNPANDTIGSLANGFRRFSCTYMGACPAIPGSGNGLLYATTPTLSVTPSALAGALTYGDAAPDLVGYAYDVSGYLGSDASTDVLSGSLSGSTSYRRGSNVGTYGVNHSGGALTSSMGYGFVYLQNASAITVGRANLTLSGTRTYDGSTIAHGSTLTALGVNGESFGLTGAGTVASRNAGTTVLSALGTLGLGPGANGALATNYNALSTSASSYAIDRAALTLVGGFGAEHKPYDGTTNATLTGLAGLGVAGVLGGDAVSLSTASAA